MKIREAISPNKGKGKEMSMNNILLVDDDVTHLHLLRTILEYQGFNVAITPDALSALKILERAKFDLIITDFNMPIMNGIALATEVRGEYSDAPIIMITGDFSPDIIATAANAGIYHVLPKPVTVAEMMATIASSLE